MEADILDLSSAWVWRHMSTTASASGVLKKLHPLNREMRTGRLWTAIFFFLH